MSRAADGPGVLTCFALIAVMDAAPRLIGFRRALKFATRLGGAPKTEVSGVPDAALVDAVAQRVALAAAFYPRRARCLEQSLALFVLLRRRGIAAELKIGVQARPFYAHAWVEVQDRPINEQGGLPPRLATFAGIGA